MESKKGPDASFWAFLVASGALSGQSPGKSSLCGPRRTATRPLWQTRSTEYAAWGSDKTKRTSCSQPSSHLNGLEELLSVVASSGVQAAVESAGAQPTAATEHGSDGGPAPGFRVQPLDGVEDGHPVMAAQYVDLPVQHRDTRRRPLLRHRRPLPKATKS